VHQDVAQRGVFFAMGGELRPDLGYPQVVADLAALGQDVGERGGDALDRGGREEQGAGVDRDPAARVGQAGHHVGDQPAVPADRDLEAGLRPGGHQLAGHGLECGLEISHRSPGGWPGP
jgi:hypothetical protein